MGRTASSEIREKGLYASYAHAIDNGFKVMKTFQIQQQRRHWLRERAKKWTALVFYVAILGQVHCSTTTTSNRTASNYRDPVRESSQTLEEQCSAYLHNALRLAGEAEDESGNCIIEPFLSMIWHLKAASDICAKQLVAHVKSEKRFDPFGDFPLFLNAVHGYTFADAPDIAPYITNREYLTPCPGISYCPRESLILHSNGNFIRTYLMNGQEHEKCVAAAVADADSECPQRGQCCKAQWGQIEGAWELIGRTLNFHVVESYPDLAAPDSQGEGAPVMMEVRILHQTLTVHSPHCLDGLCHPDPDDGSPESDEAFARQCGYVPL